MDFDQEIIADFLGEYADAQIEAEKILTIWDKSGLSDSSIHTLFRVVHSIKGNFRMMYLAHLSETIHQLEDILGLLRDNKRPLCPGLTILISTTLEQCKEFSKHIFTGQNRDEEIKTLNFVLIDLHQSSTDNFAHALRYALQTIDTINFFGQDYCCKKLIHHLDTEEQDRTLNPVPYLHDQSTKKQLEFFKRLATQSENYPPDRQNRCELILHLTSHMNASLDYSVNPVQLEAAVYMHDIGMRFLPSELINSNSPYTEKQRQLMQTHTQLGFELMRMIPDWEEAALMIQQHHERYDGLGYPHALKNVEICEGAKLLAIGDAYAAMRKKQTDETVKNNSMYTIMEIEDGKGKQFDPKWVAAFDQMIDILDL